MDLLMVVDWVCDSEDAKVRLEGEEEDHKDGKRTRAL